LNFGPSAQEYIEQLAVINAFGRKLARILNLQEIYQELASILHLLLPTVDGVYISTYDSQSQMIYCAYAMHENVEIDVALLPPIHLEPPGKGFQSEAIHTRRPTNR
jgi:hypothetical protein